VIASAAAQKKRDTEKATEKVLRPVHSVERGTRTVERKPEASTVSRSKLPVPTKKSGPKSSGVGQHIAAMRAGAAGMPSGGDHAQEAHSDSIMQILEGHDSPLRPVPSYNAVRRVSGACRHPCTHIHLLTTSVLLHSPTASAASSAAWKAWRSWALWAAPSTVRYTFLSVCSILDAHC
jgi:hypothetical protein